MSTAIIQLKYLNLAMMHFGASEVVPVYYVLFTFFSIRETRCPLSQPSAPPPFSPLPLRRKETETETEISSMVLLFQTRALSLSVTHTKI